MKKQEIRFGCNCQVSSVVVSVVDLRLLALLLVAVHLALDLWGPVPVLLRWLATSSGSLGAKVTEATEALIARNGSQAIVPLAGLAADLGPVAVVEDIV